MSLYKYILSDYWEFSSSRNDGIWTSLRHCSGGRLYGKQGDNGTAGPAHMSSQNCEVETLQRFPMQKQAKFLWRIQESRNTTDIVYCGRKVLTILLFCIKVHTNYRIVGSIFRFIQRNIKCKILKKNSLTKLFGFSPQANYTADRPRHVGEDSVNFCG
jgi:hypothetical protein